MPAIAHSRTSVVEKYRVSNCVVYKAGSSAWNSLLAHVLGRNDLIETGEVYRYAKEGSIWTYSLPLDILSGFQSLKNDKSITPTS